jgi:hypothetical protein
VHCERDEKRAPGQDPDEKNVLPSHPQYGRRSRVQDRFFAAHRPCLGPHPSPSHTPVSHSAAVVHRAPTAPSAVVDDPDDPVPVSGGVTTSGNGAPASASSTIGLGGVAGGGGTGAGAADGDCASPGGIAVGGGSHASAAHATRSIPRGARDSAQGADNLVVIARILHGRVARARGGASARSAPFPG